MLITEYVELFATLGHKAIGLNTSCEIAVARQFHSRQYIERDHLDRRLLFSTNLFTNSCDHISTNGKAPLHSHINHNNPDSSIRSDEGLAFETSAF